MANYNFPTLPPKGSKLHVNDTITIGYTGDWQGSAFTWIPYKRVKIECWGARGGYGAWGGYTWGIVDFSSQPKTKSLFYIVGQAGRWNGSDNPRNLNITYGGGGEGDNNLSGGGATDVRTYIKPNSYGNVVITRLMQENIDKGTMEWYSLSSRLIIAGGGGGTDSRGGTQGQGNFGGGFQGWGNRSSRPGGNGGQTYGGGAGSSLETNGYDAVFGAGACGYSATGGGGGGLYGGGRGDGGGGGSSYVSGISPCVFETSSGIKFESGGTTAGGANNMTNGKIVITILQEITLGDVDYGDPGTKDPPKNPGGPKGLTDDDLIDLNYIDASRNVTSSATAIINTKNPILYFKVPDDGPRDAASISNSTYSILGSTTSSSLANYLKASSSKSYKIMTFRSDFLSKSDFNIYQSYNNNSGWSLLGHPEIVQGNRATLENYQRSNPSGRFYGYIGGFAGTCMTILIPEDGYLAIFSNTYTTIYLNKPGVPFGSYYEEDGSAAMYNTAYFTPTSYSIVPHGSINGSNLSAIPSQSRITAKKGEIYGVYLGYAQAYAIGFNFFV